MSRRGITLLLDAVIRIVFAYTLAVDSVPAAGTVTLIVLIVLAQGMVMIHGRRSGALTLLRDRGQEAGRIGGHETVTIQAGRRRRAVRAGPQASSATFLAQR